MFYNTPSLQYLRLNVLHKNVQLERGYIDVYTCPSYSGGGILWPYIFKFFPKSAGLLILIADRMLRLVAQMHAVVTSIVLFSYFRERRFPLKYTTSIFSLTSWHLKSPRRLHRLSRHLHITVGRSAGILEELLSVILVNGQVALSSMLGDTGCGWHSGGSRGTSCCSGSRPRTQRVARSTKVQTRARKLDVRVMSRCRFQTERSESALQGCIAA